MQRFGFTSHITLSGVALCLTVSRAVRMAEWVWMGQTQGGIEIKKFTDTSQSGMCFPEQFGDTVKSNCTILIFPKEHHSVSAQTPTSSLAQSSSGRGACHMLLSVMLSPVQVISCFWLLGFFLTWTSSASCGKNFFLKLCKMILLWRGYCGN